jgi:hypothetical protein
MVTGSAFGVRDTGWIRKHLPADGSVTLQDLTSARATINLAGPLSRRILEKVADGDVSNETFPYMTARRLRIGYAPVLALRVTYLGELGWELHLPTEYAAHVYEQLSAAGREFGLADAGYRAIDSLRLEKRYLYWGSDITPDYTPYEAGLGFAVSLKKKSDFIGRAALERAKTAGPKRKLITLLVDAPAMWRRKKPAMPTTRSRLLPSAMPRPASPAPPSIPSARRSSPDRQRSDSVSATVLSQRRITRSSSLPASLLSWSSTSMTLTRQRFRSAWPLGVACSRRIRPWTASADFWMAPPFSRLRTITLMVWGVRKVSLASAAPEMPG